MAGEKNNPVSGQDVNQLAQVRREPIKPKAPAYPAPAAAKPAEQVSYAVGDRVQHKAFGAGEIVKMTPMGGDFLVEIKFDSATKKLMLRAAAQHMTKA